MKRTIILFSALLLILSCTNNTEENKDQTLIINNITPIPITFSVIYGDTDLADSEEFYAQSHRYMIKKNILQPYRSKSQIDNTRTDSYTYYTKKGKYDVTIYVCQYSTMRGPDRYIGKYTFTFTEDKTITIGLNGQIY